MNEIQGHWVWVGYLTKIHFSNLDTLKALLWKITELHFDTFFNSEPSKLSGHVRSKNKKALDLTNIKSLCWVLETND